MLEHNLAEIAYSNYDVFVGVYPNDLPTVRAVSKQSRRHPRIHVATCPHNGPTSKGDCLNWIYRRMQEFEEQHRVRFEIVITHDAEDMIHEIRCSKMLAGVRGAPPSDVAALREAIMRLSALIETCPEIRELDINPLKVLEKGVVALDARVRVERLVFAPPSRRIAY